MRRLLVLCFLLIVGTYLSILFTPIHETERDLFCKHYGYAHENKRHPSYDENKFVSCSDEGYKPEDKNFKWFSEKEFLEWKVDLNESNR